MAIHLGECRDVMKSLPERSVHVCITSPPYLGLRDYGIPKVEWADGWKGVFGLEPTIEMYVDHTLEICGEIRRVLRGDGTLWWNCGDSYNSYNAGQTAVPGTPSGETQHARPVLPAGNGLSDKTLKSGDLMNVPHRVAQALCDDGWYWRQTIVWQKPSPMPESLNGVRWERCRVKVAKCDRTADRYGLCETNGVDSDLGSRGGAEYAECPGCKKCTPNDGYVLRKGRWRCTNSYEFVFMFAKTDEYFGDAQAAAEPASTTGRDSAVKGSFAGKGPHADGGRITFRAVTETRNPRSIWKISTEPLKAKHFAAFPTALPAKIITAMTSKAGCCPHCGSCWAPVISRERVPTRPGNDSKLTGDAITDGNRDPQRHIQRTTVHEYRPTCTCPKHEPIPCTVMDPFSGAGSTAVAAKRLGRSFVGSEINPEYVAISEARLAETVVGDVPQKSLKIRKPDRLQRELF